MSVFNGFNMKQVSEMLPSVFFEQHVRVYACEAKNIEAAKKAFRKWCTDNDYVIIKAIIISIYSHFFEM